MEEVIRFALLGLGIGATYALASQGLIIIYRGSGVLNFALGAIGMAGAYVWWELTTNQGWSFLPGLIAGVGFAAVLGALVHLFIMRPLRQAAPLVRVIATLGVLITIQSIAILRYTATSKFVPSKLPTDIVHIHNTIVISADRLILLGIAAGLTLMLWVFYRYSKFGLATVGRRRERALGLGAGPLPRHVAALNWALRLRPRRPRRDPDRPDRHPAAGGADQPRPRRHRGGAGGGLPLLPDRPDRRAGDRHRPDRGDALRRTDRRRHRRSVRPDRDLAGRSAARRCRCATTCCSGCRRSAPARSTGAGSPSGSWSASSCWRPRRRSGSTPSR